MKISYSPDAINKCFCLTHFQIDFYVLKFYEHNIFCFSFEIELLGVTLITMNFFSDKTFASTAENGEGFHIILK